MEVSCPHELEDWHSSEQRPLADQWKDGSEAIVNAGRQQYHFVLPFEGMNVGANPFWPEEGVAIRFFTKLPPIILY